MKKKKIKQFAPEKLPIKVGCEKSETLITGVAIRKPDGTWEHHKAGRKIVLGI